MKIENLTSSSEGGLSLTGTLQPTEPFSFKRSLTSLRESGATDLNDSFGPEDKWLERPVHLNGHSFLLRLTDLALEAEAPRLELVLLAEDDVETAPTRADFEAAAEWANRRFWLDIDMLAVRDVLMVDEYGEELVTRYWPARPTNLPGPWEGLLKTVIGNQIYPGLAIRLLQTLLDTYGQKVQFQGKVSHLYPTPERLANVLPENLLGLRFSRQKARYLPGIVQAVLEHPDRYNWEHMRSLPAEKAVAALDELSGVGPWTAHYVAMRGLPHLDIFVDEEGLHKTLAAAYSRRASLSSDETAKLMKVYSPYRSFACYYTYMRMYAV
ncbi:MAG: DNA-3-methyladenine glycosylase 2 family protein [Chloroflexi bacterium]|nr:DNA-3-methyladenine glycosylase 2 family protein [Chloroflexota bacterium]